MVEVLGGWHIQTSGDSVSDETIDTGDTVKHGPTGETWVVAYVEGDKLAWVGWPQGEANLSDCTLTEKATPESRISLLRAMAGVRGWNGHVDRRVRVAQARLAAMDQPASLSQSVVDSVVPPKTSEET